MIKEFLSEISIKVLPATMLLFVTANFISYFRMQSRLQMMMDGYAECGFPFTLYGRGGIANVSEVFWMGLVFDFIIAFLASVAAGRMWKKFERR